MVSKRLSQREIQIIKLYRTGDVETSRINQTFAGSPGQVPSVNREGLLPQCEKNRRQVLLLKDKLVSVGVVDELRIIVPMASVCFVGRDELRNVKELIAGLFDLERIVPLFYSENTPRVEVLLSPTPLA